MQVREDTMHPKNDQGPALRASADGTPKHL